MLLGRQWTTAKKPGKWWQDPVLGPLAHAGRNIAAPHGGTVGRHHEDRDFWRVNSGRCIPFVLAALRGEKPADEEALLRLYGKLLAQAQDAVGRWPEADREGLHRRGGLAGFRSQRRGERLSSSVCQPQGFGEARSGRRRIWKPLIPVLPARAMAVKDKAKPVTPVIFVRGDRCAPWRNRGDDASCKCSTRRRRRFASDRSGRRELAEKIASADNPLTPRVWANHVWRHLLGRPLVKTPGRLWFAGRAAEPPGVARLARLGADASATGPRRNWCVISSLSATYQQSSADRAEAYAVDADNNLLWRANCRRMDFEAMRDRMLATSGQLDPALGGRSVNLSSEPFSGRRTIYGFVDRVNLDPLFTTFDFPSPDIASPERSQTLVPQQALVRAERRIHHRPGAGLGQNGTGRGRRAAIRARSSTGCIPGYFSGSPRSQR